MCVNNGFASSDISGTRGGTWARNLQWDPTQTITQYQSMSNEISIHAKRKQLTTLSLNVFHIRTSIQQLNALTLQQLMHHLCAASNFPHPQPHHLHPICQLYITDSSAQDRAPFEDDEAQGGFGIGSGTQIGGWLQQMQWISVGRNRSAPAPMIATLIRSIM